MAPLGDIEYETDLRALAPHVPAGTELDTWDGRTLISVVGFLFRDTRVWGVPFPFHRDFEEVNLRFYVRRKGPEGWRRGVVFLKEIVPKPIIAFLARRLYDEPYVALPMSHRFEMESECGQLRALEYAWRFAGRDQRLCATVRGPATALREGTEAEFITEHYWGYNRQPDGATLEYRVEHPRWSVYDVTEARLECDAGPLYGEAFRDCLSAPPRSAFVAEGSPVTVYCGHRLVD